jgi:pheromone shutdown protein TraB
MSLIRRTNEIPRLFASKILKRNIHSANQTINQESKEPLNQQEWTRLALDRPLIHRQTGLKIHVIGVHHNSKYSIQRVLHVLSELRPAMIGLEIDHSRIGFLSSKSRLLLRNSSSDEDRPILISSTDDMTSQDRLMAEQYGLDPSSESLQYALEMAAGLKAGKAMGSIIKLLDVPPKILMENKASQETKKIIESAKIRFRLGRHIPTRTSSLGSFLYNLAQRLAFKGINMQQQIDADRASLSDHAYQLQIWSRFYPTPYYWFLELRNAVMLENLFTSIQTMMFNGLDIPSSSKLNADTIALVVGKSHVFGLMEMWNQVLENAVVKSRPEFSRAPLTSDPLPDLSDLTPGKTDYDLVAEALCKLYKFEKSSSDEAIDEGRKEMRA